MKKISINGKEYNVKYTIRALFTWESIMDRPFSLSTMMDNYVFYYSMILANNPDDLLQWDDFLDALDNDPNLIKELAKVLEEQESRNKMISDDGKGKQSKQKKS